MTSSVQDHLRNTKRSFTKTLLYAPGTSESDLKVSTSLPQDSSSDVKSTLHSPSGALIAILRETSGDSGKKRFVEIWSAANSQLEAQLEVTSVHGAFYSSREIISIWPIQVQLQTDFLLSFSSRLSFPLFLAFGDGSRVYRRSERPNLRERRSIRPLSLRARWRREYDWPEATYSLRRPLENQVRLSVEYDGRRARHGSSHSRASRR